MSSETCESQESRNLSCNEIESRVFRNSCDVRIITTKVEIAQNVPQFFRLHVFDERRSPDVFLDMLLDKLDGSVFLLRKGQKVFVA